MPVAAADDVVMHVMPNGAAIATIFLVIEMSAADRCGSTHSSYHGPATIFTTLGCKATHGQQCTDRSRGSSAAARVEPFLCATGVPVKRAPIARSLNRQN
jgi:hypothetical protein